MDMVLVRDHQHHRGDDAYTTQDREWNANQLRAALALVAGTLIGADVQHKAAADKHCGTHNQCGNEDGQGETSHGWCGKFIVAERVKLTGPAN